MNAAETLLSTGKDDAIALVCGDDALTYAQLRERVARTAGWLRAHQVASGDRVIKIVDTDLTSFQRDFVPCGIHDRGVTSIALELSAKAGSIEVKRNDVERVFSEEFLAVFDYDSETSTGFPA